MQSMVELTNISFQYRPNKPVFENLSLSLQPGFVYGLLGRNGAGKSSLLRLIGGLLFPSAGTIHAFGYEPRKRQPSFLEQIFFIPEEIFLPPVTLQQFLDMVGPFYPKFNQEQFYDYLSVFDVPQDQRLTAMSYGQKKKVIISFGLAANTRLLLMDEPTNGLDIPSKRLLRQLIASALVPERLLLISTHQIRDLDHLIDAVVILEGSQILLNHTLSDISQQLLFGSVSRLSPLDPVLYTEPCLGGHSVVMENLYGEDSEVDLERLFHTVLTNTDRIRELFAKDARV